MLHFDTDYMEGAHPEVMRRLMETNLEQTVGYGNDEYTRHARDWCAKHADSLKQLYIFW